MDNGFYDRMEIKLVTYERQGSNGEDIFVVIMTDEHEHDPIVIRGNLAKNIIDSINDNIDKAIGAEGS